MNKSIALYLQVHQPYRIRHYTVFDAATKHDYFDAHDDDPANNERILKKVAEKSYLPANRRLLKLLNENPGFKLSLSLSGVVIEQLERWSPKALESFKELVETGRVEILAETYHHSLAFFYSREEFEVQVDMHRRKIEETFHRTPAVFRNTELAYNNELARWADQAGYKGILAEGWDPVLEWRSPNHVYRPAGTENIRLLMKNYRLSDDIAFRFGNREWKEWPLTADKFAHWMSEERGATNFDLFMDYETFGEHQWEESGVFDFLENLPGQWLKTDSHSFKTVSETIESYEPVGEIDVPHIVTWADTERDLSAWLGNAMQSSSIQALYDLRERIIGSGDWALIEDWRRLQTSDHFYYMCTKWWNDGDIHAYFSPYENPYEAYINFMNAYRDLQARLAEKGVMV
jgi:alpha-amylase